MAAVALSAEADREVRRLRESRSRVERIINSLAEEPRPANLDVKPLVGRHPWSRVRVGSYRLLFRPLTPEEMRGLGLTGRGYYVARVVHRRDLERTVARLR